MAVPHLGILAGLQSEARCLSGPAATIELSGARLDGAITAAARLVAAGATHLMSFGLAGGLDPSATPGTVLLPSRVIAEDGRVYPVDRTWHDRVRAALADLAPVTTDHLGTDTPLLSAPEKSAAFDRWHASGVDMESHILAAAAASAGLPFLVIRAVADPAAEGLPPAALVGVKANGATDILAVLGSVIRRPAQIPALMRLARYAAAGERSLLGCGHRCGIIGFGMS